MKPSRFTDFQIFDFAEENIEHLKEQFEQTLFWLALANYNVSEDALREDLSSNLVMEYSIGWDSRIDTAFIAFVKGYMEFANTIDDYLIENIDDGIYRSVATDEIHKSLRTALNTPFYRVFNGQKIRNRY